MTTKKILTLVIIGIIILVGIVLSYTRNTSLPTTTDKGDLIRLESPVPGSEVGSPILVKGIARGNWYFEASFPIVLTDWDGRIIGGGIAQAKGEWMTVDFVPFEGTITYDSADVAGYSNKGFLILKKDNPSGLPEHDDALEVTIYLK